MIYEFTPTQDLHGYSEPWAPGAGKNKFDENAFFTDYNIPQQPDGSYYIAKNSAISANAVIWENTDTYDGRITVSWLRKTLNADGSQGGRFICKYSDGSTAMIFINNSTEFVEGSNTTADDKIVSAILWNYGNSTNSTWFKNIQVEYGDTKTSFAPYSNICPISGYNIWDPVEEQMIPVYAGYVNANTRELYLRPVYEEYAGEELVGPWMSSLDPYAEDTTPTTGAFVIDFGGELTSLEITPFMLQTLLDSLGIRQHFTNGAGLLNSLMDQAQGRVRSEEELLHLSRPLKVIAIGDHLPAGITFKPISKDVLPGLPGKFIR